jgi:RNA polymerase sigma factor (sigma-70 family)
MAPVRATGMPRSLRRALGALDRTALTDGQLLERYLAAREEAAFEALVRRHGPMVLGVCRRVLKNSADAEDAFQATFLVLVRKAAAVLPRNRVGHWLYGVAYRTALKARSTTARRQARERTMSTQEAFEAEAADDWLPLLDHELNRLPEKYRLPVVLCDLEGKTRKEAARHLDWPEGTVATRLTRGRSLLAVRLARRGVALTAAGLALGLSRQACAAGMPAALVSATVRAATDYAACPAAAAAVSARVAALTEGVLKSMLLTRLKTLTAVVVVLGLLGTGLGTSLFQVPAAAQEEAAPPERTAERVREVRNVSPHELPSGPPPQQAVVSLDEDGALIAQVRKTYYEPVTTLTADGRQVTSYRLRDALQTHHSRRGEYQTYDTKLKKIAPKELSKRLKEETPALVFWAAKGKRIDPLHLRFIKDGTLIFTLSPQVVQAVPPAVPVTAPPLEGAVPPPAPNFTPPVPPAVSAPRTQPPPAGAVPPLASNFTLPVPNDAPLTHPLLVPPASVAPVPVMPPSRNPSQSAAPLHPLQILLHQDGVSKLLRDIQGDWAVVSQNRDGKRVEEDEYRDYRVVIRGGKMWLSRGNSAPGGKALRLEIDSSKSPATIDTYLEGPQLKKLSHGILKLQKVQNQDVLMICEVPADRPRPTSFEERPAAPWFGTVYKRLPTMRQQ